MIILEIVFWICFISSIAYLPAGFILVGKVPLLPVRFVKDSRDKTPSQNSANAETSAHILPIALIVPARNEAKRLAPLLTSLKKQHPQPMEICIVDDQSSDNTAGIAADYGFPVITAEPPPEGWTGKAWACWNGYLNTKAPILLFLDADTMLGDGALQRLYSAYTSANSGVQTVHPYHLIQKPYETLSAFPDLVSLAAVGNFPLMRSSKNSKGNTLKSTKYPGYPHPQPGMRHTLGKGLFGPCILVSRETYQKAGGHKAVAGSIIEDVELGNIFAQNGISISAYSGKGAVYFRMYGEGIKALIEGWAKNLASGSYSSNIRTTLALSVWITGMVNAVLSLLLAIPLSVFYPTVVLGAAAYLGHSLQVWTLQRKAGKFGVFPAVFFPFYLLFFLYLFAKSRFFTYKKGKAQWKGRSIAINASKNRRV